MKNCFLVLMPESAPTELVICCLYNNDNNNNNKNNNNNDNNDNNNNNNNNNDNYDNNNNNNIINLTFDIQIKGRTFGVANLRNCISKVRPIYIPYTNLL